MPKGNAEKIMILVPKHNCRKNNRIKSTQKGNARTKMILVPQVGKAETVE